MSDYFFPKRVFIEENALNYPLGKKLYQKFLTSSIPLEKITAHNKMEMDNKMSAEESFKWAKETLVIGVKKTLTLQPCSPSADYRLVLGTSCPGKCEYCYLASTLGPRVYLRIYVNIEEILQTVDRVLEKKETEKPISFEASSSSDPVPTEHLTGLLSRCIEFFSLKERAKLRIVTKFHQVEPLLDIEHKNNTLFRFSLNAPQVIEKFEGGTSSLTQRLNAGGKIHSAGYPLGFIIAPLLLFPGWKEDYQKLFDLMREYIDGDIPLNFELIMHRFTKTARRIIEARFPSTALDFSPEDRVHKGFGKYVYNPEKARELKDYLENLIQKNYPRAKIQYFT